MTKQLSIDFDPDISRVYESCTEYVQHLVHTLGVPQKAIAADMDLSPSHLSRKLAQNPNDSMRLTLDDLEKFMRVTGCREPIKWLVSAFYGSASEDELKKEIERLQRQLQDKQIRKVS